MADLLQAAMPSRRASQRPRFSYAVGVLDRSIRRSLVAVLRPFELTVAEYTTLSLISRRGGYSNAELASRSFVSPQAMHEMISSLEGRGLLERAPSQSHRSIRLTHLTDKGRDLLRAMQRGGGRDGGSDVGRSLPRPRAERIGVLRECARNLRGYPPPD